MSLALAAWVPAAPAAAHDGAWAQLGVPLRFDAPLLWDGAGERLVGIGASAFGAADSIEDAWEFRTSSGWRRLRLPQPPAGLTPGFWGPVADPARRRFVQPFYTGGSYPWSRLWALELAPEPHWVRLDEATMAPADRQVEDLSGEALWVESYPDYPQPAELWSRSLADSGRWRRVRAVPSGPWSFDDFIDSSHDRRVTVAFDPETVRVWSLPLSGAGGWTLVETGPPSPPKGFPGLVVPDAARRRVLFGMADVMQPGGRVVWALDLSGSPRWELLGPADYDFGHLAIAIGGDTLVLHGQGRVPGQPGARTIAIALGDPTRARVLSDPVWPPPLPAPALVPDAARGRWLLVGGRLGPAPLGSPLDSLWELRLEGSAATWRPLAVTGGGPAPAGVGAWTVDEAEGTLWFLGGWNTTSGTAAGARELWALRPESPPRWERVASGGVEDWPRLKDEPVFVFDALRRKLVCFGNQAVWGSPPLNEVWEYAVDDPAGWTLAHPLGTPPAFNRGATAAYDAASARVVMIALNAQIAALHTSPELRWELVDCAAPASGECLRAQLGMRGISDPVGRRLLELGGYDWSWPHVGEGHRLFELPAGDSLGPTRMLAALGSPGWQDVPVIGLDGARDGLLVFGNGQGTCPNLLEFSFDRTGRAVARPRSWLALGDRNALRWAATPGATFRLWRRAPGESWTAVASISSSASGELAFDDRAIESGTRYGYRLGVSGSPLEPVAADVWLTAATSGSVLLAGPWPNPARGTLGIAFSTLATAPATLELFDVAGRRVWSRRWDAPVAGPHHVTLGTGELPRAGLYFVRLRQAGITATRRVVIAP